MNNTDYDYLIVGYGLAGSIISYQLAKSGKKILIIDTFNSNSSSQVAAGLVNPVTGRRVVKSWMADVLIPFAEDFYKKLEKEFGETFYYPMDVLEVIHRTKDLNEWTSRMGEIEMKKYFTKEAPENLYVNKINEFKKMIRISSSAWMNIPFFIDLCKRKIKHSLHLVEEEFENSKLKIGTDFITYDNNKFKKIIFCEGYKSIYNPLWNWLPFVPAKGEILLIECIELPEDFILLGGIFLIPIGNHKFRVGSTYEWNFKNELPSEDGKLKLLTHLNNFLKIPFIIIEHRSGIRPTVKDRRPFIGQHPDHANVYIFNGMGTKGVQLIPYFGDHFVNFLVKNEKLHSEININRFL